MTDFFIFSIKSTQCTDKYSKKNVRWWCFFPVFWCTIKPQNQNVISEHFLCRKHISQSFSNFLISNACLYHFLVQFLSSQYKSNCPEMRSQSFPVSEISHFWYIRTWGRKIAIASVFQSGYTFSTLHRFYRENKKKSVILYML